MPYRDKDKYRKMRRRKRDRLKAIIVSNKNKPCSDCRKSYPPCVMEYDHVRGVKRSELSKMVNATSARLILEEVAKCEVVCANCHRIRHWLRTDPILAQTELLFT